MAYRSDLDAAHARTEALEREVAEARRRNSGLEAAHARIDELEQELAEARKQNAALTGRLAKSNPKLVDDPKRRISSTMLRVIATGVILLGLLTCYLELWGEASWLVGIALVVCWFLFVMPGEWQRK